MFFKEGIIEDSFNVSTYAMDLHYPKWDTLSREESDIPERINEYDSFIISKISISDIEFPYYELDENNVEEYSKMDISTAPPIVITEKINGKHEIIDGCHRYCAAIKNSQISILAFVPI